MIGDGGGGRGGGGDVEVIEEGGDSAGEEDTVTYLVSVCLVTCVSEGNSVMCCVQGEGTAQVGLGGRSQWRVGRGDSDIGEMEGEDMADSCKFFNSTSLLFVLFLLLCR